MDFALISPLLVFVGVVWFVVIDFPAGPGHSSDVASLASSGSGRRVSLRVWTIALLQCGFGGPRCGDSTWGSGPGSDGGPG